MSWETSVAIIFIGTVALMFKFADSIDAEHDWSQALKLLVNFSALFVLIGAVGWAIQLQRTTVGVDTSLIDITTGLLIAVGFVVIPILVFFLILFLKSMLEIWEKKKKGPDFG